jgi:CubicO group peptidase (beta-lactamase class C family)
VDVIFAVNKLNKNSTMNRHTTRLSIWILVLSCLASCARKQEKFTFPRTSPEKEGVRTVGILRFLEEVQARGIEMHSLMILRHGKVVTEGWWYPYRPKHRHIMHSVSKTFTSTAIGFAVDEKRLTVDDAVISFFPGELPAEVSPYLSELKVRHLLTMSAGQSPAPSFALADGDWVKLFLATPIVHRPGTVFEYSSYASHMLSAIIRKVTGQTLADYLRPRLFEPLDITDIQWETDALGNTMGGWGLRIQTEDMAKLGQFYLQQGRWQGRQLLSKEWIREASSLHIYQRDNLTLDEELHDNWAQGYGYQIWRCTDNAYRADGADGQFIIVMPEQDAIVVITENTRNTQQTLRLVFEYLLPVMMEGEYVTEDEDREELSSLLSALAIPDPFRTAEETEIPKNTVRSYNIDPNNRQAQNVSFAFDEAGNLQLTLTMAGNTWTFPYGADTWRYGETTKQSPYFLSPRRNIEGFTSFTVAGYGSWTAPDELRLRLLYVEDYQQETVTCRFDGDRVTLTWSTGDPAAGTLTLTGQLQ